jgi:(p)ppGpp synthase/HD superfamily hydrolase
MENTSDRVARESKLIDKAIDIAARSDDLAHLVRVARKMTTIDQILTAWLHDSVEDGYCTVEELRHEEFPDQVIVSVVELSRRDGEKYEHYIERLCQSGDYTTLVVKRADLSVNLARAKVDRFSLVQRYIKAGKEVDRALTNRFVLRAALLPAGHAPGTPM